MDPARLCFLFFLTLLGTPFAQNSTCSLDNPPDVSFEASSVFDDVTITGGESFSVVAESWMQPDLDSLPSDVLFYDGCIDSVNDTSVFYFTTITSTPTDFFITYAGSSFSQRITIVDGGSNDCTLDTPPDVSFQATSINDDVTITAGQLFSVIADSAVQPDPLNLPQFITYLGCIGDDGNGNRVLYFEVAFRAATQSSFIFYDDGSIQNVNIIAFIPSPPPTSSPSSSTSSPTAPTTAVCDLTVPPDGVTFDAASFDAPVTIASGESFSVFVDSVTEVNQLPTELSYLGCMDANDGNGSHVFYFGSDPTAVNDVIIVYLHDNNELVQQPVSIVSPTAPPGNVTQCLLTDIPTVTFEASSVFEDITVRAGEAFSVLVDSFTDPDVGGLPPEISYLGCVGDDGNGTKTLYFQVDLSATPQQSYVSYGGFIQIVNIRARPTTTTPRPTTTTPRPTTTTPRPTTTTPRPTTTTPRPTTTTPRPTTTTPRPTTPTPTPTPRPTTTTPKPTTTTPKPTTTTPKPTTTTPKPTTTTPRPTTTTPKPTTTTPKPTTTTPKPTTTTPRPTTTTPKPTTTTPKPTTTTPRPITTTPRPTTTTPKPTTTTPKPTTTTPPPTTTTPPPTTTTPPPTTTISPTPSPTVSPPDACAPGPAFVASNRMLFPESRPGCPSAALRGAAPPPPPRAVPIPVAAPVTVNRRLFP